MLQQAAQAGNTVALKRVYTTRLSSRNCALQSLRYSNIYVLIVLTKLELMANDKEEKSLASGLKKYLENFTSVLLIVYQNKVLNVINPVSQMLQKENRNLSSASDLINKAIDEMKLLRNSFDEVKEEAVNLARVWGVNEKFQLKRLDEWAIDQRLTDPEKQFQVNVFRSSIDIVIIIITRTSFQWYWSSDKKLYVFRLYHWWKFI